MEDYKNWLRSHVSCRFKTIFQKNLWRGPFRHCDTSIFFRNFVKKWFSQNILPIFFYQPSSMLKGWVVQSSKLGMGNQFDRIFRKLFDVEKMCWMTVVWNSKKNNSLLILKRTILRCIIMDYIVKKIIFYSSSICGNLYLPVDTFLYLLIH